MKKFSNKCCSLTEVQGERTKGLNRSNPQYIKRKERKKKKKKTKFPRETENEGQERKKTKWTYGVKKMWKNEENHEIILTHDF